MSDIRELKLRNTIQYSITQYKHTYTISNSSNVNNYKMLDIADMNQNL